MKFLNSHRNIMTCIDENKIEKSYMKYSFDTLAYTALFEDLLVDDLTPDDDSVLININAISPTGPGGTPETVLDYMIRLSKDKRSTPAFIETVKNLILTFTEDFDARRFINLTSKEADEYERLQKMFR